MKVHRQNEASEAFRKAHLSFRRRALGCYLLVVSGMFVVLLHYANRGIYADTLWQILFYGFFGFTVAFFAVCAVALKMQQKKFSDDKGA